MSAHNVKLCFLIGPRYKFFVKELCDLVSNHFTKNNPHHFVVDPVYVIDYDHFHGEDGEMYMKMSEEMCKDLVEDFSKTDGSLCLFLSEVPLKHFAKEIADLITKGKANDNK